MVIVRGEIWWANLREPVGFSHAIRPIKPQPHQYGCGGGCDFKHEFGECSRQCFSSESPPLPATRQCCNVSQLLTVDKVFLTERVAVLPTRYIQRIEDGIGEKR